MRQGVWVITNLVFILFHDCTRQNNTLWFYNSSCLMDFSCIAISVYMYGMLCMDDVDVDVDVDAGIWNFVTCTSLACHLGFCDKHFFDYCNMQGVWVITYVVRQGVWAITYMVFILFQNCTRKYDTTWFYIPSYVMDFSCIAISFQLQVLDIQQVYHLQQEE